MNKKMTLAQDEIGTLLFFFVAWYFLQLRTTGTTVPRYRPALPFMQTLRMVAPPPIVFGIVWFLLYGLIASAQFLAWRSPAAGSALYTWIMALFIANLLLNKAWVPLFFEQQQARAALAMLVGTLVTAVALLVLLAWQAAQLVHKPGHGDATLAAVLFSPYVAWLAFALYLNARFVAAEQTK